MVEPPSLPPRLTRLTDVLAVCTALWLLAAAGFAVAWAVGARPLDIGFVTCVVGAALGGLGYTVFRWQRAAARSGSRTAQKGL